jgi:hypothetical protein
MLSMLHVRPARDVETFIADGAEWVRRTGGVSTSTSKTAQEAAWWCLPAGSLYDEGVLAVVNDHGDHWYWEPVRDMPMAEYKAALRAAGVNFIRA